MVSSNDVHSLIGALSKESDQVRPIARVGNSQVVRASRRSCLIYGRSHRLLAKCLDDAVE